MNPQGKLRLTHELTAFNYAEDYANKIHSEEFASAYGFTGGLVPGIGVFAYMTHPLAKQFGRQWLNGSMITAKFIRPIYDGDGVMVEALETEPGSKQFNITASNAEGKLCAVGSSCMLPKDDTAPGISDYPRRSLPPHHERIPARVAEFVQRTLLGTVDFQMDTAHAETRTRHEFLDDLGIYSGSGAIYHPAFLLEMANQIFKDNIALGPWIHTKSELKSFSVSTVGEPLNIRGYVIQAFEKGGHELIEADLAIFNQKDAGVARIKHTAIIRLGVPDA